MKTSELLTNTWLALEGEHFELPGHYERRILSHSAYSVFIGITRPSKLIQFSLAINTKQVPQVHDQEVRGFRLNLDQTSLSEDIRLRVEITDPSYKDIFLIVASDILDRLLEVNDERQTIAILQRRIEHWKKFMQASGLDGLSRPKQIGLFGELLVLKSLVGILGNQSTAITSWRGPKGANQDFISKDRAIEVKTSTSNEMSRVQISNEHQLDTTGLGQLFLCHICLDEKLHVGISLPALIDEIQTHLPTYLLNDFLDTLAEAGYLDVHRSLYEEKGYIEKSRFYYRVSGEFPRITPTDLMVGINEVSYQIDLSSARPLRCTEAEAFTSFLEGES